MIFLLNLFFFSFLWWHVFRFVLFHILQVHSPTLGTVKCRALPQKTESPLLSYQRLSVQGHLVSHHSGKKIIVNPFFPMLLLAAVKGFIPLTFQCTYSIMILSIFLLWYVFILTALVKTFEMSLVVCSYSVCECSLEATIWLINNLINN